MWKMFMIELCTGAGGCENSPASQAKPQLEGPGNSESWRQISPSKYIMEEELSTDIFLNDKGKKGSWEIIESQSWLSLNPEFSMLY